MLEIHGIASPWNDDLCLSLLIRVYELGTLTEVSAQISLLSLNTPPLLSINKYSF